MTLARVPDRLIVGVNPLFGVDHYLRERARDPNRSKSTKSILRVLQAALNAGAGGININSGPQAARLIDLLVELDLPGEVGLYPMVPDERFFGSLLNRGTLGAVSAVLSGTSLRGKAKALFSGSWAWLTKDPFSALRVYLATESDRMSKAGKGIARVRTLIVHELIADAMLGLGATEAFSEFVDGFKSSFDFPPGVVTRNFVRFTEFCNRAGINPKSIIVLTPINSMGFQMSPSRAETEKALKALNGQNVIGMSLLASGAISLPDAIDYIKGLQGVYAYAVGVSTPEHAQRTFQSLSELLRGHSVLREPA